MSGENFRRAAGARLSEQGYSLRKAGRALGYDPAYLSRVLAGKQQPSLSLVQAIDALVEAGGGLVELADVLDGDEKARLAHSLANPFRLDIRAVDSLADMLASQRRADDALPASAMIRATDAQAVTIKRLLKESRGPHVAALGEVVAEYVQFSGWLHAEVRNDRTALIQLNDSLKMSRELKAGLLAAQALNFQAYVARQQDRPEEIARLFQAAYRTPGASPAQRMGDAAQAVQGLVAMGRREEALRLLGEAMDLSDAAEQEAPPGTAYWLTPNFQRLNLGIAYHSLGEHRQASESISDGLAGLPPEQQNAEWTQEHRGVLAAANAQL